MPAVFDESVDEMFDDGRIVAVGAIAFFQQLQAVLWSLRPGQPQGVGAGLGAVVRREPAGVFEVRQRLSRFLVFDGPAPAGMELADDLMAAASAGEPVLAAGTEPGATMIYTSGTTGKPKGAFRSGSSSDEAKATGAALLAHIGYTPDDVYLTTGPLYHSGPGGFMNTAQAMGQTVVVQRKFDPEDWMRLVSAHGVTSTFSAPTPIRMVCNLPDEVKSRYDVSSMRRMIANAAPWSFTLKKMYLRDFPEESLFEVYGSTELGVNCVLLPEDQLRKPGSCGKPAPGVEIKLFDEIGRAHV